jgi:hypothetical protein
MKRNMRGSYDNGIGAEGRKADPHLVAANARVHDLA